MLGTLPPDKYSAKNLDISDAFNASFKTRVYMDEVKKQLMPRSILTNKAF